ncbi:hypothetical protein JCM10295v2_004251 [Rhodotorula toruloides]
MGFLSRVNFYIGHILVFIYGWLKQARDARLAGLNTLKYSVWASRGAGLCLGIDGLFLVLPVLRNAIRFVRPVLGRLIPLDENLWMHRQFAYSLLFWTIVHTTGHYVNMYNVELTQIRKEVAWAILFTQPGGFTGHVMLILMLLVYTTAHVKIRNQSFEAFWYTHHLVVLILFCLYIHAVGCFVRGALPGQPVRCLGYNSWTWTIWGGIALLLERIVRELRSRRATKLIAVLLHPQGALELRFVKPSFRYKSGQWLFLNVPAVSPLQWHPFTISSAPEDPYVSVHIRQVGDWTRALGQLLGCDSATVARLSTSSRPADLAEKVKLDSPPAYLEAVSDGPGDFHDVTSGALDAVGSLPPIRIDGPFGAPTQDVFRHEVAVLIGAGIGITPFASALKTIWCSSASSAPATVELFVGRTLMVLSGGADRYKMRQNRLGALRRVQLVFIVRNTADMSWFHSLFRQLEKSTTDPDFFAIRIYLTQPVSSAMLVNIAVQSYEVDAVSRLISQTHYGRPDFDVFFRELRTKIDVGMYLPGQESSLTTDVGVFYCGPPGLAKELKSKTKKESSDTVRFIFKKEHFPEHEQIERHVQLEHVEQPHPLL